MTQRNPMNERTRYSKQKGVSRKSASSAKPARAAGSSVYTTSAETKKKRQEKEQKAQAKAENRQNRKREAALGATVLDMPRYKKFRRIWLVLIIVAIVAVLASWVVSFMQTRGDLPAGLAPIVTPITVVGLVVGYGAIIAALVIDFKVIRKMRREKEAKIRSMSKRELRALDAAIAENDAAYEAQHKGASKIKMPWSKDKTQDAQQDSTDTTNK